MDNRGVSDAIGFTLVFALIITSISVVSVTALDSIEQARESQERVNTLRAFEVMSENFGEIANSQTESRSTEIQVIDSQLYFGDKVEITVTYSKDTDFVNNSTVLTTGQGTRPIVYRVSSDQRVTYVNGAIIQSVDNEATFYKDPIAYTNQKNQLYLSFLRVNPRNETPTGVGGGTRIVYGSSVNLNEQTRNNPSKQGFVQYNITGTRNPSAWANWCRESPLNSTSVTQPRDDKVVCVSQEFSGYYSHRSAVRSSIQ